MPRPWSKVTKLVQAKDATGLVELLCRSPPLKVERLDQVQEGLRSLPVALIIPPILTALGHDRVTDPELASGLKRLLTDKCEQEGPTGLLSMVRTDEKVRPQVHEILKRLGPSRTLKPLIELLANDDRPLRRWTRGVIHAYDPFITVPTLLERLEGPADLKEGVVETLGLIRDPQAVTPLVTLLGKTRGPLRESVQAALVRYQDLAIEPLLKVVASGTKSQREGAIETLERLGELPVSTRVKIGLFQGSEDSLRQIGPQAFETLREALEWKDPHHRFLAAKLLGEMDDDRVLPALEGLLTDSDPPVRHMALEGLGKLGHIEALTSLLKGLEDPHDEVARTAALALSKLGDTGIQSLVEALASDDQRVSRRAGKTLLNLGTMATEPLWAAFESHRPQLVARAAEILGRTPDLDLARRVELFIRQNKPGSLSKLGPKAIPLIVEILGDPDDRRQGTAVTALGKMGAETVQPLVKTLAEDDLRRRRASLQILANLGQPAYEGLLKAMEAPDARIRRDAVRALGLLGEGKALSSLALALKDAEPRVAKEAAQALIQLGAPGIERLGRAGSHWGVEPLGNLLNEGTKLVNETTKALVGTGAPARKALEEALNNHQTRVRVQAAAGLGQLKEAASAPALLRALSDEDPKVRDAARESLVQLGVKALPSLLKGLKGTHWFMRREASLALGAIGDPRAIEPLMERLGDSDREVQAAAIKALEGFKDKALESLLLGLDMAPQKERDIRQGLLTKLGGANAELLVDRYLVGTPLPILGELLEKIAPRGLVAQRLEALDRLEEARLWYDRSGLEDDLARLNLKFSSDEPSSPKGPVELPEIDLGGNESPDDQRSGSKQIPLSQVWEPTSDVSTQLQRLIIAHNEGALTDQEFARAKEKLLGL